MCLGDTVQANTADKICRWGPKNSPMHVVTAGSAAGIQRIDLEAKPKTPEQLAMAVVELNEHCAAISSDDIEYTVQFLAVHKSKAYFIDSSGGLVDVNHWACIGSGAHSGIGLMSHFSHLDPKTSCAAWKDILMSAVLPAITRVEPLCGPPYTVKVFRARAAKT